MDENIRPRRSRSSAAKAGDFAVLSALGVLLAVIVVAAYFGLALLLFVVLGEDSHWPLWILNTGILLSAGYLLFRWINRRKPPHVDPPDPNLSDTLQQS